MSEERVSAFDEAHTTNVILDTLAVLGAVSDAGALFMIIILSCRWSQFIFRERKIAVITTHQYMRNAYVTALLLAFSGLYVNLYSTSRALD